MEEGKWKPEGVADCHERVNNGGEKKASSFL